MVAETTQTQRFVVTNAKGSKGKIVAGIGSTADGGVLVISNKNGKPVAEIGAESDGDSVVRTMDNKGQVTSTTP